MFKQMRIAIALDVSRGFLRIPRACRRWLGHTPDAMLYFLYMLEHLCETSLLAGL